MAAATGVGLANSVMDTVNNVQSWYHKAIVADFYRPCQRAEHGDGARARFAGRRRR